MKNVSPESHVAYLFPAHGSQYFHMGADLFANDPCFRSWIEKLDVIAAKWLGTSIMAQIYDRRRKSSDPFSATRFTHPAVFMVEYALARTLENRGFHPAAILGASLGEYAAAAVARIIDVESVFELVLRQGLLVDAFCEPGGMLTILHSPTLFRMTPFLYSRSELVAENYYQNFIIAASDAALNEIETFLSAQDIVFHRHAVKHALHSRLMEPAASRFLQLASIYRFQAPTLPFYSSVVGGRHENFDSDYFWRLARRKMRFRQALEDLERTGPWTYIDVGPSGTLAGMGRSIIGQRSASTFYPLLTQAGGTEQCLERLFTRERGPVAPRFY